MHTVILLGTAQFSMRGFELASARTNPAQLAHSWLMPEIDCEVGGSTQESSTTRAALPEFRDFWR